MDKKTIDFLSQSYSKNFVEVDCGKEIPGSPERSIERFLLKSAENKYYLAEKHLKKSFILKNQIAGKLSVLKSLGLDQVNLYYTFSDDSYLAEYDGFYWQISDFIQGTQLKRPEYVFEKEIGLAAADFLVSLKKICSDGLFFEDNNVFSLKSYIFELVRNISKLNPDVFSRIEPVLKGLGDFFENYDNLKLQFCHGDFHPLNIIWEGTDINKVIDWEFCGFKPEIYDAANFLGCIGVENPDSLSGPLAESFLVKIFQEKIYSGQSLYYLPFFVTALRFAWLSEWLRKKDPEMIELEIVYMNLLINNIKEISRIWNLC
ncbi:MAG: aminoglycoside phosphotransferase [Deltaproteobacteria bacterium]|nr:MAG: aminoglycoside phosphotransferase [Deltaproteobacteria bacterium]